MLYQYTVAMVDLVLNDLSSPAGEGFDTSLEFLVLPLDFDGLKPLAGARVAQKGQAALPGIVRTGGFEDLRVEHSHICPLIIKDDDPFLYADHIGCHTHTGIFVGSQGIQ